MASIELGFESEESSLSVRRFAVHEAISNLFSVSVWARSRNDDIDLESIVGRYAELRVANGLAYGLADGRRWTGVCLQMEHVEAEATGLSMYYLRIAPALWLLTQRENHRLFQHMSIPDIVDALLTEWRLPAVWKIQRADHKKLELRTQYGESDFAFLSRLLEEAGISYHFAADDELGSQIVLTDAPHVAEGRTGEPLPFVDNPNQSAEREFVSAVRVSRDVRPGRGLLDEEPPAIEPRARPAAPRDGADAGGLRGRRVAHRRARGLRRPTLRPPRATPKPRVLGVESALVVGPRGQEIHTDEHGRVRVQFHWDREGEHDENSSCWLRVSQGWGGQGYGMITFTTGEASITLDGPDIVIEAKGKITVKSKGDDVFINGGPNVRINCNAPASLSQPSGTEAATPLGSGHGNDPLLADPNVKAGMKRAAAASDIGGPHPKEHGGFILKDPKTGELSVEQWPPGNEFDADLIAAFKVASQRARQAGFAIEKMKSTLQVVDGKCLVHFEEVPEPGHAVLGGDLEVEVDLASHRILSVQRGQ